MASGFRILGGQALHFKDVFKRDLKLIGTDPDSWMKSLADGNCKDWKGRKKQK